MTPTLTKEHIDSILRDLRRDPVKFLEQFQVAIGDWPAGAARRHGRQAAQGLPRHAAPATDGERRGPLQGPGAGRRAGGVRRWGVCYKAHAEDVVIHFTRRGHSRTEQLLAHSVEAQRLSPAAEVPASADSPASIILLQGYELGPRGPELMLTEQLDNACFAMVRVGDRVYCGHIAAAHADDTERLCQKLRRHGRFAGLTEAPLWVFGPPEYAPCRAQVLGMRIGGTWQIVAQLSTPQRPGTSVQRVVRLGGA